MSYPRRGRNGNRDSSRRRTAGAGAVQRLAGGRVGHRVVACASANAGREALASMRADVLLADIRMTTATEGIDLLAWTRRHDPNVSVVLITGVPEVRTAVEALRLAAYDYLVKPVPQESLLRIIGRAAEHAALQRARPPCRGKPALSGAFAAVGRGAHATLERRTNQLLLLNQVVSEISALQESAQATVARAASALQSVLGYQDVAIYEIDRTSNTVRLPAAAGAASGLRAAPQVDWSTGNPALIHERTPEEPHPRTDGGEEANPDDVAVFPIAVGSTMRYLLVVPGAVGADLDAADATVLATLTEHLGIALANADLYNQLRGALQVREQILQNVSHELRTPLTLISGYSELLLEREPLTPTAAEMLGVIIEQTEHLAALVNQLLTLQSIESNRIPQELIMLDQWLAAQVTTWRPIWSGPGCGWM
ncbi:MAG: histidine kinase dimerization/phospho-acceptor domain-containing protein [Caldilineales bacterium]